MMSNCPPTIGPRTSAFEMLQFSNIHVLGDDVIASIKARIYKIVHVPLFCHINPFRLNKSMFLINEPSVLTTFFSFVMLMNFGEF